MSGVSTPNLVLLNQVHQVQQKMMRTEFVLLKIFSKNGFSDFIKRYLNNLSRSKKYNFPLVAMKNRAKFGFYPKDSSGLTAHYLLYMGRTSFKNISVSVDI